MDRNKRNDLISGFFLIGLSALVCWESATYGIGGLRTPGSGIFPLILGLVIGSLSLITVVKNFVEKESILGEKKDEIQSGRTGQVILVLALVTVCCLLMERLGYFLTMGLLFAGFLIISNTRKWYVVLGGSALVSVLSHLLFRVLLQIELPRGILGI